MDLSLSTMTGSGAGSSPASESVAAARTIAVGEVILGKYRVERELGEGGMGVLLAVRHLELDKLYALKVLRPQVARKRDAVERFLREAQVSVKIRHEHVAEVLDVGRLDEGGPYMLMEYLHGKDLKAILQESGPLPLAEAVDYVLQVCDVLAAAHAQRIVHRDIKPSNVFLTRRPNGSACVKVIDFGIAKEIEPAEGDITRSGEVMGSPLYMSPEQMIRMEDVEPRTDVWAVGAVLYELLTGRAPFKGQSLTEVIARVLHAEPPSPTALRPGLPAWVDSIVMRCLRKAPEARFGTMEELAAALQVRAAFPTRDRVPVAPGPVARPPPRTPRDPPRCLHPGKGSTANRAPLPPAAPFVDVAHSACCSVDISDDLVVSGHENGTVRLWKRETGLLLRVLDGHTRSVLGVAFSPDGAIVASASSDRTIRIWRPSSGEILRWLVGHDSSVRSVAFSGDGRTLAYGADGGSIRLWDVASGQLVSRFTGQSGGNRGLAFSPDSTVLASSAEDGSIQLWGVSNGQPLRRLTGHTAGVMSVAFSPDRRYLASGSSDATVRLWDICSGKLVRCLTGHFPGATSVAFSPDGRTLVAGADSSIRMWAVASGEPLRSLAGHSDFTCVRFSADGRTLVSGSSDTTVGLWDATSGRLLHSLSSQAHPLSSVAFSPDGRTLACGSLDNTAHLWEPFTGRLVRSFRGHSSGITSAAFSPDGGALVTGADDASVRVWDVASGRLRHCLDNDFGALSQPRSSDHLWRALIGHRGRIYSVAFSPDGRTLAAGSETASVRLWDSASGGLRRTLLGHSGRVWSVAFSPDGHTLASGSGDQSVRLWDVSSGELKRSFTNQWGGVMAVTFSQDGGQLACGACDGVVRLWHPSTGELLRALTGHSGRVRCLTFSADGRILASGAHDKTVRLWHATTGHLLCVLGGHFAAVSSIAFHPSGRYLAAACSDGAVHLWSVADATRRAVLYHCQGGWVAYRPDGRYKINGDVRGSFWHVVGLDRYEAGELEERMPSLRIPDEEPIVDAPPCERHYARDTGVRIK